ncbi:HAD family hydrolase [Spiractinospora alimapuensis]|uniref:HAD family hydrolase n=1 Tax=Spiractinospora alimapuensis TaxID=2820884 RepID=UPI001F2C239D|nr:HAD family hydrolase [Spiractinospora alimapuensis]QVQ52890.1 HAD family hydrolase [Spiractinospora alimapuensis]
MTVEAVLFDWGGTLTPWLTVDTRRIWVEAARRVDPDRAEELGGRLATADGALWQRSKAEFHAFTQEDVFREAGIPLSTAALDTLREEWEHATFTDPQVPGMLAALRERGLSVGILSNTPWPREWHEGWLRRDGVLDSFDGSVFTSEIPWNKPHAEAFRAGMAAIGVTRPQSCVYVGDRLFEDVWGPQQLGMRAVHIPHSVIPPEQGGHTQGVPDATIQELAELAAVLDSWA